MDSTFFKRWRRLVTFSALSVGMLVIIFGLQKEDSRVSMAVRGITTNQWAIDADDSSARDEYVCAVVEFTNESRRAVTYWGTMERDRADYRCLFRTPTGWEDTSGGGCGLSLRQFTLDPSQSIRFEALVDPSRPCKIALDYSVDPQHSRLWQRLPQWILDRLPWTKSSRTVMTEEIDFATRRQ
jgi:hypothetical protein